MIQISIHTPTKGATLFLHSSNVVHTSFQSTLPRRERRKFCEILSSDIDFNPHSHEGSDWWWDSRCSQTDRISIHTPTKGATSVKLSRFAFLPNFNPHSHEGSDLSLHVKLFTSTISIHTPTKGATFFCFLCKLPIFYFNPHSHEGSDSTKLSNMYLIAISIHTPTKGATFFSSSVLPS